jgi:hypothetical protein
MSDTLVIPTIAEDTPRPAGFELERMLSVDEAAADESPRPRPNEVE